MKKFIFLIILVILNSTSCDVIDLVLTEKKVSLILNSNFETSFNIDNNSFNETFEITATELLAKLNLPEESTILDLNVKKISATASSKAGNQANTINFNGYINQLETNTIVSWKDNQSLAILEPESSKQFTLLENKSLEGINQIKEQLLKLIEGQQLVPLTIGVRSVTLEQMDLKAHLIIAIDFDMKVEYCGLVPGNSELPECEE